MDLRCKFVMYLIYLYKYANFPHRSTEKIEEKTRYGRINFYNEKFER